jgi:hypothetical protein
MDSVLPGQMPFLNFFTVFHQVSSPFSIYTIFLHVVHSFSDSPATLQHADHPHLTRVLLESLNPLFLSAGLRVHIPLYRWFAARGSQCIHQAVLPELTSHFSGSAPYINFCFSRIVYCVCQVSARTSLKCLSLPFGKGLATGCTTSDSRKACGTVGSPGTVAAFRYSMLDIGTYK